MSVCWVRLAPLFTVNSSIGALYNNFCGVINMHERACTRVSVCVCVNICISGMRSTCSSSQKQKTSVFRIEQDRIHGWTDPLVTWCKLLTHIETFGFYDYILYRKKILLSIYHKRKIFKYHVFTYNIKYFMALKKILGVDNK